MQNRFTIIIRDEGGVRQFTLHRRVKHALAIMIACAAVMMAVGGVSLLQLGKEVRQLEASKVALATQKSELESQSRALQDAIAVQQDELGSAKAQMNAIEMAMGLQQTRNVSLDYRVKRAVQSSEERMRVLQLIPNGSPVPYNGISSKFGYRTHPITKKRELHRGTDMKAEMNTPVRATADGVVEFAGEHDTKGYGRLIILDHSYGFRTLFGHLSKIVVKSGQVVKKGDLIGYSGSSGLSNGPHLHYEVRFIQRSLNPYWFIKWNMANYDEIFTKITKVSWEPILQAIADEAAAPGVLMTKAEL